MSDHSPQIGSVADLAKRIRLVDNNNGLAPVTFLIGAGCSVSAGIPVVKSIAQDEIRVVARKLTGKDHVSPVDALISLASAGFDGHRKIAEDAPDTIDWGAIYDLIFQEIHTSPDAVAEFFKSLIRNCKPRLNWAHLALGELARRRLVRTTITTNFDLLVLEGYARAGIIPVVSDGIESLGRLDPRPDTPQVLQINGSLHSYRLRNSPKDLDILAGNPSAAATFRTLFRETQVLVVVGYQGREPQIMGLLTAAAREFPDKHIFWTLYSSNPAQLSKEAREFLSYSVNARLIPGQDADLFFNALLGDLGIRAPQVFLDPLASLELLLGEMFDSQKPELGSGLTTSR